MSVRHSNEYNMHLYFEQLMLGFEDIEVVDSTRSTIEVVVTNLLLGFEEVDV